MCRLADDHRHAGVVHAVAGRRRARPVARADGRVDPRAPTPARRCTRRSRPRPFGMLLGFPSRHGFSGRPTYRELRDPLVARRAARRAGEARRCARRSSPRTTSRPTRPCCSTACSTLVQASLDRLYSLGDPPDYEPTPDRTDRGDGRGRRRRPDRRCSTTSCSSTTRSTCSCCRSSTTSTATTTRSARCCCIPAAVSGLSDGGAHCLLICDASIPTFMLTHWARDRTAAATAAARVRGEEADVRHRRAVRARRPRRRSRSGKKADVNVIDFERLTLQHAAHGLRPARRRRAPPAGRRAATSPPSSSGEVTRRHGVDTGARPGRLLRGAR